MTDKPKIRSLNGICKVKNASLFFDYETRTYHLVHYETEILTIKYHSADIRSYEIVKALKCSNSSTRAIYQVTDFLNIPRYNVKLEKYDKFTKYSMSTDIYFSKNELRNVIDQ